MRIIILVEAFVLWWRISGPLDHFDVFFLRRDFPDALDPDPVPSVVPEVEPIKAQFPDASMMR